jgi:hypothetical protein
MTEKNRFFSQTSIREATAAATVGDEESPGASQAVVPAKLDPRATAKNLPKELGGVKGPEPTRFGDWEHNGRCTDF